MRWLVLLAALLGSAPALADKVDELAQKLRSDPDYKVRLSAALNLGKLGDPRAIAPLIDGLGDGDRTVRGVAAAALGKLVGASAPREIQDRAITALDRAARGDGDVTVRSEAGRSLAAIRALRAPPPAAPPGRTVYVEVGPMADNTRRSPAVPAIMRQHVVESLGKRAPQYLLRWPTGRAPTDADLRQKGTAAFYVDGSLVALNVSRSPPHVGCSVSLVLATYPAKSLFGFMRGGAEVDPGSSSERAIAEATSDCVGAVLDDLVGSKLVPTIQARAP
jgi:hypothetical protein